MAKITVKRAYRDGSVRLGIILKASGYGHDSVNIDGNCELFTVEARDLAANIIEEANRVDAVEAKKKAAEQRRKKWRDREIESGRLKIMSPVEFLGGRR